MLKKDMKSLKKWAKQFSESEWELLCAEKDFNDILMEDAELAVDVAENVLKKKLSKPY
jgi:hypothetical protein